MIILHLTIMDGPFNDLAGSLVNEFLEKLDDFSMGVNGKITMLDGNGVQLSAMNVVNGELCSDPLTNGPEPQ